MGEGFRAEVLEKRVRARTSLKLLAKTDETSNGKGQGGD